MEEINRWLSLFSDSLYTYVLIILLVACGLYFSFRTKFVQIRLFPEAVRVITEKKKGEKGVSSFQALMISTASRVGTGNIAGVATAIAAGGPGAIFWMWLLAVIGSASAFIESTLAQIYKKKDGEQFRGGPAYYIQQGLGSRKWGIVFSILLICCFAYGFNALQSFNVSSAVEYYSGGNETLKKYIPLMVGAFLAILTALVIFGGVHRISAITSFLVPVMAVVYIGLGLFITFKNASVLPAVFSSIFEEAFDFKAISGGFMGSCVMLGIKRGLFSNEAGMGSAPNAAATADVSHPVKQGLVQMLSVFIDTILICSTTAMMLLVSGVGDGLDGLPFVQQAISSQVGSWGIHFITVSIFLFAFSSLVGNYYYTESNLKFIKDNSKVLFIFRLTVIAMIFVGAQMPFDTVWTLADILMGLMAVVNLVAIFLLGRIAVRALKDYMEQKRQGKDPVFKAKNIGLENTELWK